MFLVLYQTKQPCELDEKTNQHMGRRNYLQTHDRRSFDGSLYLQNLFLGEFELDSLLKPILSLVWSRQPGQRRHKTRNKIDKLHLDGFKWKLRQDWS